MNLRIPSRFPRFWVQTGKELLARINYTFARKNLDKFALRITGGCGNMSVGDASSLFMLVEALQGYSGLGLFGGTQMRNRSNAKIALPSINDVFPALDGTMLRLGIIPKTEDMRIGPDGMLIVHDQKENPFVTIAHPGADELLEIQPSGDGHAIWDDEWKQSVRIVDELQAVGWNSLLLVYNGGEVTERELLAWAKLGRETQGGWRILIVKGSGRTADKYATDEEFLKANPHVAVCEAASESIRKALLRHHIPFNGEKEQS